MSHTLLVTGASGFIGSHLAVAALDAGYQVWAAVRSTSSRAWLTDERLHIIELDIDNADRLAIQLKGRHFDYIIHAAGATKSDSEENFVHTNAGGTRNLVSVLKSQNTVPRRFIFISSLSVFGPVCEQLPHREICDSDTPCPNTAYGRSKLMAEQYLQTAGIPYVILRPTGVYGPRERDYFVMAQSVSRHIDFAVGFAPQHITFVYVLDLCQAALRALTANDAIGRAFFVSDGSSYDSAEFSRLVQQTLKIRHVARITVPIRLLRLICTLNTGIYSLCQRLPIVKKKCRQSVLNTDKFHILAQRNWRCDISATRQCLGYTPEWTLARGVRATIEWYQQHHWL